MSTFGDTSGFLAVLNADDADHRAAAETWGALVRRDETVITTNYVVVETISLLQHRFGVRAVRRFTEEIVPFTLVDWVDERLHAHALAAVIAGSRRGPSLVDRVSFETMRRRSITSALAFDRHFEEQGYRLPGTEATSTE